jgi:hypothetical protein
MEKEAGAMEYAAAGKWPGGEEGWRAAVLERGEREDGGRSGTVARVVVLEHARGRVPR